MSYNTFRMIAFTSLLRFFILSYAVLFFFLDPSTLLANPHSSLSIKSNVKQVQPKSKELMLLAKLNLSKGWYTYWDNPGDAGLPLNVTFTNNAAKQNGPLLLPPPQEFNSDGLISFGYLNDLHFGIPITIKIPKNQTRFHLEGTLSGLICEKVCIPFEEPFSLTLDIGNQEKMNSTVLNELNALSQTIPKQNQLQASFNDKGIRLHFQTQLKGVTVYPKHELIDLKNRHYDPKTGDIWLPYSQKNALSTLSGFIQTETETLAFFAQKTKSSLSFILLVFAFLGGLILNIMPCVLPILSLKVLSIKSKGSFKAYLGYQAGILVSFYTLALLIEGFKQLGFELGWGFQLQSPYFVGFLIVLFGLLGLNMLGIFEIGLFATRFAKFQKPQQHILSGILMTIVATPCSAPFVGSSVAIALSHSMTTSFLLFTALGFGLGFPFLAIALIPSKNKRFIKPGVWMLYLKQFLSLGLFATSLWLVYLLQRLNFNLSIFVSLMIFLATVFLLFKHRKQGLLQKLIVGLFLLLGLSTYVINTDISSTKQSVWEPFDAQKITYYEQSKQAYFIDFTALWCLTCQSNKINVLNNKAWQKNMKQNKIKLIKADWTNHNPDITKALKAYDRIAVPTYVYFDGQKTILLPDLLTKSIVLNYINLKEKQ